MSQLAKIDLGLHHRQGDAFQSLATEILYGGAAGGGKSHLMRVAAIVWCAAIAGLQVYLFRRIREDLQKNHMEGPKGLRAILAPWVDSGFVVIVEDEIRFWNGSKIYLCHCKDEKDRFKYQGAEIHVLMIDELTTFTDTIYRFLRGRVRAPGIKVPDNYKGRFPRILCGSNPGNVGHVFVKSAFIDNAAPMETRRMPDEEGGMLRQYIPALLDDNPTMAEDDPTYRARLRGLGSETLVRAMEKGDWDIIEGAFFDCWRRELHVIKSFAVPKHWTKLRGFDWGSAKPFSYGEYAVSDGQPLRDGRIYPKGALIKTFEWYGCRKNTDGSPVADVGLKLTAEGVAAGIIKRAAGKEFNRSVADPAIFSEDGGPSIGERMFRSGVKFVKADNCRVARVGHIGGWDQVRARLIGETDDPGVVGVPMLYLFETCHDSIRTIPALQHDPLRAEDLDTNMEDHAADELRYVCMSRPWTSVLPVVEKPRKPTMDEIWEQHDRNKARTRGRI